MVGVFVEFQPVQGVSSRFCCNQLPRNYNPNSGRRLRRPLCLTTQACLALQPWGDNLTLPEVVVDRSCAAELSPARSLVSFTKSLPDVNLEAGL